MFLPQTGSQLTYHKDTVLVVEYGPLNNDPRILLPADTLNFDPSRFYNFTMVPNAGLNNSSRNV